MKWKQKSKVPKRCQISEQPLQHPSIRCRKKQLWIYNDAFMGSSACTHTPWFMSAKYFSPREDDTAQSHFLYFLSSLVYYLPISSLSYTTLNYNTVTKHIASTSSIPQFSLFLYLVFTSSYLRISLGNPCPLLSFFPLITWKHKLKSAPYLFLQLCAVCPWTQFLCCFDTLNVFKHTLLNTHALLHAQTFRKRSPPWR